MTPLVPRQAITIHLSIATISVLSTVGGALVILLGIFIVYLLRSRIHKIHDDRGEGGTAGDDMLNLSSWTDSTMTSTSNIKKPLPSLLLSRTLTRPDTNETTTTATATTQAERRSVAKPSSASRRMIQALEATSPRWPMDEQTIASFSIPTSSSSGTSTTLKSLFDDHLNAAIAPGQHQSTDSYDKLKQNDPTAAGNEKEDSLNDTNGKKAGGGGQVDVETEKKPNTLEENQRTMNLTATSGLPPCSLSPQESNVIPDKVPETTRSDTPQTQQSDFTSPASSTMMIGDSTLVEQKEWRVNTTIRSGSAEDEESVDSFVAAMLTPQGITIDRSEKGTAMLGPPSQRLTAILAALNLEDEETLQR